jgi:small subunit ribosomal protein S1
MVKVVKPGDDKDAGEVSPQEFERMLEESQQAETVFPGEIVSGQVVSMTRDWVFVDIGCKAEGMIAIDEFAGEDGEPEVKVGDRIEATVLTTRGGIRLARSVSRDQQTYDVLQDAFDNQIPVEGRVKEIRKGGFGIELGSGQVAFCPISQIDARYVEKPEEYVGQTFNFRIIEFDPEDRNIIVSRRALIEEELQAQARETREKIKPGVLMDGIVKKIMPYGAFVGVGGMDGLVHVSEISWDRVENPADYLTEGQKVTVKVLAYDTEKNKLSLSLREAGADPWETVAQRFPVGTTVSGAVTRVEPYGAFVRIASGIEGLVHVSDITWAGRLKHAGEVVSVGTAVQVVVLNLDRERKRLSLGMKQITGDPFVAATEKYKVGQMVAGTVKRIGAGGIFVEVEEGVVGFLPGSLAGIARGEPLGSAYKIGKSVSLLVKEVDPERRRMTLQAGDASEAQERSEFEAYAAKQGVERLGSFGELLQKALDKNRPK